MGIDFLSTVRGSLLEGFLPAGWDLRALDACCAEPPAALTRRRGWWHQGFAPAACETLADLETMMGHAIALRIARAREEGKPLALILPVGPMGMYRWVVYFLRAWGVGCDHVHGFNMDEWSDARGATVPASSRQSFQYAMEQALYGPLGKQGVPARQRHFATRRALPRYAERIATLRAKGASLTVVYGIGRVCHIAFWEPHFAAEYDSLGAWRAATHRIGAKLHPLTIEQNAITSFKSRTTLVSCYANTIGPGLFLSADEAIGGCDGALGRGMNWQAFSLRATLLHKPTPWLPSTWMTTRPGVLFYLRELAEPLEPECN